MKLPSAQHQGRRSSCCPEADREIERFQLPPSLPFSLESHWAQHRVASPKYECAHITRHIVAGALSAALFTSQLYVSKKWFFSPSSLTVPFPRQKVGQSNLLLCSIPTLSRSSGPGTFTGSISPTHCWVFKIRPTHLSFMCNL